MRDGLRARRTSVDRAGHRRPAVPVLQGRRASRASTCGRSPASCSSPLIARARCSAGRSGAMRPVRRPVLHGRGVPAAGDQERRQFALLFGTTWVVNALVFAGVLVVVLAAVETTRRFRTPPLPVVFAGIAASLARLRASSSPTGCWRCRSSPRLRGRRAAGVPADLPGQRRLRQAVQRLRRLAVGLRVNLLGAIVGGCLEYAALLTGYRTCCWSSAALYLVAFLLKPRLPALAG